MKKTLLSLSAVMACMSMSAAVPVLKEQYKGSIEVTSETATYSNPSAYDAQGNLIITGSFNNDFKFNGMDVFGEGVKNAFILKYDATNSPQWGASVAGSAVINGVDTDAEGNIYVGGTFAGKVEFLSATADGEPSISKDGLKIDGEFGGYQSSSFIAKYDKDGKIVEVTSFVPESLPELVATGMYYPSAMDLYFAVSDVKVADGKVYAAASFTGQTTVGNGTFDGAYSNLFDFMFFDVQNVGIFSVDCATLGTAEIVAKMELAGPFADSTPSLSDPVMTVKDGQVIAGFIMSTSEATNTVNVELGSYKTTLTPTVGVVDYVIVKDGAVASIQKPVSESFITYDGLNDLVINGNDVYMVGSFDTAAPAAEVAAATVAPVGKSDVFVAKFGAADLSVGQIYANAIDEGENGSEKVSSSALVDGALYINTVGTAIGGSYWFDGTAFSIAPATGCGLAVGNGVMALVSSDATKVDYQTYTYESKQTGINDIEAEFDPNAPVEYFNLQGIRVDNPENGLYIRRQGNKVEKIIVK